MADSPEAVKKAQKLYLLVGAVLFIFTVVTVMVATVPWLDVGDHGFDSADMTLGLLIATVKATLVAAIFMHLSNEKRSIYVFLAMAAVFFAAMILLIWFAYEDPIRFDGFYGAHIRPLMLG
jgi:caa(3)-type oxidase subunit IV